ncbi:MAG: HTH domain-containing protein [Bacteroidaceae bacterium]|nr:HTH domain-containing protein [Bacteroidaceae bacterium]
MNKRTVSIIHQIMKSKESITITTLAQKYDVSERTIRNDINAINEILSEHKIPKLELKNGGQIAKTDEFLNIISLVSTDDFYTYKLSKQERIIIASALLVQSSNYITLSEIADKLLVSRATVINDLDHIKQYIKKGNLNVLSRPNKGLYVVGKESDKRTFLIRLASPKTELENSNNVLENLMNKHAENKMIIEKILNEQEHIHESFLIDESFKKIKRYLLIMVNRNYDGEYMEVQNNIENSKYDMAQDILKYISQYCHITTTKDEILYLSELLKMARYIKQKSFKKDAFKIQMITRKFIEKISEELEMDLNKDYNFFENLSNHLESVFTTEAPNYSDNLSVRNVIKQNQNVFIAVKKHLNIIRKYVNRDQRN